MINLEETNNNGKLRPTTSNKKIQYAMYSYCLRNRKKIQFQRGMGNRRQNIYDQYISGGEECPTMLEKSKMELNQKWIKQQGPLTKNMWNLLPISSSCFSATQVLAK